MANLIDLPNEILEKIIYGLDKSNTLGINKRFYNLTKNKKFKTLVVDLSKEIEFEYFENLQHTNLKIICNRVTLRSLIIKNLKKLLVLKNLKTIFLQVDLFVHETEPKKHLKLSELPLGYFILHNVFKILLTKIKIKNFYFETKFQNKNLNLDMLFFDMHFKSLFYKEAFESFERFIFIGSLQCFFIYDTNLKFIYANLGNFNRQTLRDQNLHFLKVFKSLVYFNKKGFEEITLVCLLIEIFNVLVHNNSILKKVTSIYLTHLEITEPPINYFHLGVLRKEVKVNDSYLICEDELKKIYNCTLDELFLKK